jgi:hypothetical protein
MAVGQGKEHCTTLDRPTTLPPAWAESLLRLLLASKDRESVSVRAGVAVAVLSAVIGGGLASVGTLACLAVWHDAEIMRAIEGSGGLDEALPVVPVLLTLIGAVTGTAGALLGKVAFVVYGFSRPNTKSA